MSTAISSPSVTPVSTRKPLRFGQVITAAQVVLAVALVILILLPVLWMITTSLKTTVDTFAIPPVLLFQPTLEHYEAIYAEGAVFRGLLNSVIVASAATLLSIALVRQLLTCWRALTSRESLICGFGSSRIASSRLS